MDIPIIGRKRPAVNILALNCRVAPDGLYFFDSGGLVKRYIAEAEAPGCKTCVHPMQNNRLYISRITGAEVIAALYRRQRMGDLLAEDAAGCLPPVPKVRTGLQGY